MSLREKLFAQMRANTQKFLADGPAAATAAIQRALQKGLAPLHPAASNVRDASQSHPMHDINPKPEKQQAEAETAAMADAVDSHAFTSDLLDKLSASFHFDSEQFADLAFFRPEFPVPPFPQPHEQTEEEVGIAGRFIAGTYTNHAGSRPYKLYIPSDYRGQALPLLVMLHGCTQTPDDFAAGTRMNAIAEEKQCFVVYPAQIESANTSRCWNWFKAIDQQRDQGEPSIIAGITRHIMQTQHIEPNQVYVAGLSAGGAMAVIMGTQYPDLYAAVGVHSGLPYASARDLPSALAAMKDGASGKPMGKKLNADTRLNAIPIIVYHGDCDTTVHPRNGERVLAQNAPDHGRAEHTNPINAAASHESGLSVSRGKVPNGHAYTRTMHQNQEGRIVAEHWVIHGAAHAWSGGSARGSYTDVKGPDASEEMMRFFYTQRKAA